MTPEHQEAYDLVGELIARSRAKGHFVDLNERDWSRCIDKAEKLLVAQIRKPSKRRRS